ncbi:hypothetical protein TRFO_33822 [Tritrichomonas foetus]|uniref:Uncharacterized protein n=1 Tax=Tritrichomonas foetus TaxID=1144522 RepID=A0A1J4JQA4_9EUKA|nr:hypothetical protein TRFO_33822 [Tritrichomonas foetus]|eukprot:OHS99699.1 hypothetical protein TRFO_33822 [Tritrichomonas foetus]
MDLCRTRDVLLGILPLEEMLPLEQAVELFKPQTVDHNVKELPPEAVITQNTKIVAPESSRPFEDAERKQRAKEAAAAAKKEAAKQAAAKKKAKKLQNTLFGEGNDDVESLFSADLKKPTTSPVKKPKPAQNSKSIKSPSTSTSTPASESTTKKITETPAIEPPRPAKPKSVGAMSLSAALEKPKKKLFDDNDDALDKRKPKQPPKKEKPKDSLFDDDDDIILKL